jgi:hypothetical protein
MDIFDNMTRPPITPTADPQERPWRPRPETVARIAEFLSLTAHLDASVHSELGKLHERAARNRDAMQRVPVGPALDWFQREQAECERIEAALMANLRVTRAEFIRANELGFHLAMELPISLWRAVIHSANRGDVPGRYAAVDIVRGALGSDGEFTAQDYFWAAPGIGVAQAGPPPPHSP